MLNFKTIKLLGIIFGILLITAACNKVGQAKQSSLTSVKEPVILHYTSYMLNSAQASDVYYKLIEEFEKLNPDIKIAAEFVQNASYMSGIKLRLLGGEKLDIFDVWSPSLFEEIRRLSSNMYLELSDQALLEQYLPQTLEPVTIDGKVYGLPDVMHTDGLLYNKTLFESLQLNIPNTWDEFIALCHVLKSKGIIPIAMDAEWSTPQFFWGSIMSNNGADGEWTKQLENGELTIDNEIFIDAIQKNKEIIDREFVPSHWESMQLEQARDMIASGKAAMMVTGTWSLVSLQGRESDDEFGYMAIPGEEQTVPNINIGGYRVIHAKTEYPEEARRFVEFMNSKTSQEKLSSGVIAVPSILDAAIEDDEARKIASLLRRDDATIYWPHTVSTELLQVKIQEGVNKYLLGGALEDTLQEIDAALKEARFHD